MLPLLPLFVLAAAPTHLRLVPRSSVESGVDAHQGVPTDAELVALAVEGERGAFRQLYDRHVDRVTLRAGRLLRSKFEAQDVVQDAFLEALRDLRKLREPARFGAWLERIVVHQVHRRFRKRRVLHTLGLSSILSVVQGPGRSEGAQVTPLDEFAAHGARPEQILELRKLDELLNEVSLVERSAWMLRRVDELPLAEVAVQCECSLATVKRRIAKVDAIVSRHFSLQVKEDEP